MPCNSVTLIFYVKEKGRKKIKIICIDFAIDVLNVINFFIDFVFISPTLWVGKIFKEMSQFFPSIFFEVGRF